MQILHIDLRVIDGDYADMRYGWENPNAFESRRLFVTDIQDITDLMEVDYYVARPEDYVKTGKRLYAWLDGSDRWLSQLLDDAKTDVVLAIASFQRLSHLPWEVLHDGNNFLVARPYPIVVPVRWQGEPLTWNNHPIPNRPLQTLFMAASPEGVTPVLGFETEEGRILEATQKQPLTLTVEESGCLEELENLLTSYTPGYFDVVHLTGHADFSDGKPLFITESETGSRLNSTSQDIAKALQFRFPSLLFLSGCRTGQSGRGGEVPSMAAELLNLGASAVLGWGRPVLDTDGILAAEQLYSALAAAKTLPQAMAMTYRVMIEKKARDWHLLRLYVTGELSNNLVTPLRTKNRQSAPRASMTSKFLDAEKKVKVPTRGSFIGRRRALQDCLRALQDFDSTGILLYGMGGLGKSSLAARLCDRLPDFERVVWSGSLDEAKLVNRLAEHVRDRDLRQRLQDPNEDLKYRLRELFEVEVGLPFLLVLDDFEVNLEEGSLRLLKTSIAKVLGALLWAVESAQIGHKVLITCRYDFEFTKLVKFYKQSLDGLRGADLRKKCEQLEAFSKKSGIEESLKQQAIKITDGNPRLLEWLSKLLCNLADLGQSSIEMLLERLEDNPTELREQVLADALVHQIDEPMREMLSRALLYELPVPREAITIVCEDILQIEVLLDKAIALGLLEKVWNEELRVPRILPLQPTYKENLARQAAKFLADKWLRRDWVEGIKSFEVYRIAMQGKEHDLSISTALSLSQSWLMDGFARKSIDICEATFSTTGHPRLLLNLAVSKSTIGLIEESYNLYHTILEVLETSEICKEEPNSCLYIRYEVNNLLSDIYDRQGKTKQALVGYLKSLIIAGRLKSKEVKADAYRKVAGAYMELGRHDQAFSSYNKALLLIKDYDNSAMRGGILHDTAKAYSLIGDHDNAMRMFNLALNNFKKARNPTGLNLTLHEIGRAFVQQEDYETALPILEKCLDFFESSEDVRAEAKVLHEIGLVLVKQGRAKKAVPKLKKALDLESKLEDSCDRVITLNTLAGAYLALNYLKLSSRYIEKSLELIEEVPECFAAKADAFGMSAAIHLRNGSGKDAIKAFHSSRKCFNKSGDKVGAALATGAIGSILYEHFREAKAALKHLEASFKVLDELDSLRKGEIMNRILFIRTQLNVRER